MKKRIAFVFFLLAWGTCPLLAFSPAEAPPGSLPAQPDSVPVAACAGADGALETQDCDRLTGWAWCSAAPDNPVVVELYEGTVLIGELLADQFRADLLSAGRGNGRHGFVYPLPNLLKDGLSHTLTLRVKGTGTVLTGGTFALNCSSRCGSAVPPPQVTAQRTTVSVGEPVLLSAGGCAGTVRWSNGQIGSSSVAFPSVTTTYSATCQVDECVSNAGTVRVQVGIGSCTNGSGHMEVSGCEIAHGWAWCPTAPDSPVMVELYDGNIKVAEAFADRFRSDLVNSHGNGYHGFSIPIPDILKDGQAHYLSVRVKDTSEFIYGSNRLFACGTTCGGWIDPPTLTASVPTSVSGQGTTGTVASGQAITLTAGNCNGTVFWSTGQTGNSIQVNPIATTRYTAMCQVNECMGGAASILIQTAATNYSGPNGFVDWSNCDAISGWAWCSSAPDNPIIVELYEGTTRIMEFFADQFRQDLKSNGIGNGYHGFQIPVPVALRNGQNRTLTVRVKGSGSTLNNGTLTLNCGSGSCSGSVPSPVVTASVTTVSPGDSVLLTGGNCQGTLQWSTGQTGGSITVSPTATTTYGVTCVQGGCQSATTSTTLRVGVGSCTNGSGHMEVSGCEIAHGWAWCPTAPDSPVMVELYGGNTKVAEAFADRFRSDLVSSHGNGYHGFSIPIPDHLRDNQAHYLSVKVKGTSEFIYGSNIQIACGSICGGWIDPPTLTASVRTIVSDQGLAATINSGQTITLTAGNCNGTVFWSTGQTGSSIQASPTATTLYTAMCRVNNCLGGTASIRVQTTATSYSGPNGSIDGTSCDAISGWAWCSSAPDNPIVVELYDGATKVAQAYADQYRQDLRNNGIGNGYHGFYLPIPLSAKDGAGHSFSVRIAGTGHTISGSPLSLSCPNPCTPVGAPYIDVSGNDLCPGESTTLTVIGCPGVVNWSTLSVGPTLTVSPSVTTTYSAVCVVNGCPSPATSVQIRAGAPTTPTIQAGSPSLCQGGSVTLTAAGCSGTIEWSSGQTGASVSVSPAATTTYTAICRINNCTSPASNAVTVAVKPVPVASVGAAGVLTCANTTVQLTGSANPAGGSFAWTGPAGAAFSPSASVASPVVNKPGAYTLTVTLDGCSSSVPVNVTENKAPPQVSAGSSRVLTCGATSAVLNGSSTTSGVTYQWSGPAGATFIPSATVAAPTVSMAGTYTLTVTNPTNGCSASAAVTVSEDKSAPTVSLGTPPSLSCSVTSVPLTATASPGSGVTYAWTVPAGVTNPGNVASFTASVGGSYSVVVTRTDNGCSATASRTLSANQTKPTLTLSTPPPLTCATTSVTLTVSSSPVSGISYSWVVPPGGPNPGNTNSFSTQVEGSYQVTATRSDNGCSETGTLTVLKNVTKPVVEAGADKSICAGDSVQLLTTVSSATGQETYSWSPTQGIWPTTSASPYAKPVDSQTYRVTVNNPTNGCSGTDSVRVTVKPKPNPPTITSSIGTVCRGESVTLTSSCGIDSTVWSTGAITSGATLILQPTATAVYSARCTRSGCLSAASSSVQIVVNPIPAAPTLAASANAVCLGDSIRLTAGNCSGSYSWNTSPQTTSVLKFVPEQEGTFTYTVHCKVSNCVSAPASTQVTVSRLAAPVISKPNDGKSTYCTGDSVRIEASACATGQLRWSNGVTSTFQYVKSVTAQSLTFTATCQNGQCTSSASNSLAITFRQTPAAPVLTSPDSLSICQGDSALLSVNPSGIPASAQLLWQPGNLTGVSRYVKPITTTIYYAQVRSQDQCLSSPSSPVKVIVKPRPQPVVLSATRTSLCAGDSTVLSAVGCSGGTVHWLTGQTGATITVAPVSTTTYQAYCFREGCAGVTSGLAIEVTVPGQPTLTASSTLVDANDPVTITASGCNGQLRWLLGDTLVTSETLTVRPQVTTDYRVACELNGCRMTSPALRIKVNGTWPPRIEVLARPEPLQTGAPRRAVRIRWAPNTVASWQRGIEYGYRVQRTDLSNPTAPPVELTTVPLKPLAAAYWPQNQAQADSQTQRAILGHAIYGTFERDTAAVLQFGDDSTSASTVSYALALIAADLDYASARDAGLGLVDSTALPNRQYSYRVWSEVPAYILTIDSSSDTVSTAGPLTLPPPPKPAADFGDRRVQIRWPSDSLAPYVAYFVQRSEDSLTYTTLNVSPISELVGDATQAQAHFYVDSLAQNNKDYYYRILGITPLEERTYSEVVKGRGRKAGDLSVVITRSGLISARSAAVAWGYVPAYSDSAHTQAGDLAAYALARVELQRADRDEGPFTLVKSYAGSTLYTTRDSVSAVERATYLRIVAYTQQQDTLTSAAALIQPVDETPPAPPTGFTHTFQQGGALGDSLLVIRLSWAASPEPDLAGYSLYRSYRSGEEPVQIMGDSLTTVYQDTVSLRLLNEYVYYRLGAIDRRFNQSELSARYAVRKPDVIPPSAPVFRQFDITTSGVQLSWAHGQEADLRSITLVRRSMPVTPAPGGPVVEPDTSWQIVEVFTGLLDTLHLDASVQPAQAYAYALVATDSSGLESQPSIPLVVQIPLTMAQRAGVSGFTAVPSYTLNRVRLSWQYTAPGGTAVRSFQVYRSEGEGPLTFWKNAEETDRFVDDYTVRNDTVYRYAIRILFTDGAASPWQSVTLNYVK